MKSALSALGKRTVDPPISWLIQVALENPNLISLAAGFTDSQSLPVDEVQSAMARLARSKQKARQALQYGSTSGLLSLREFTTTTLASQDGKKSTSAVYDAGRMIISHGSQQFLYTLMEAVCDTEDIILVEDPSYFVFLGICQSHGVRCRGIRIEEDGIDLDSLERTLESLRQSGDLVRLKMLYLVTYFQNPSSYTTSLRKKQAALKMLGRYEKIAGHPIYLVEDAAYRDLQFTGEPVRSCLSLPRAKDRVVYSGTYSKPFATGLRLGFGLLPKALLPVLLRIKGNHDFGTAHLLQHLLMQAIESGSYQSHLPLLRERYAKKASVMDAAMKKCFPASVQWTRPQGGLYFWVKMPDEIKTGGKSPLFRRALAKEVLYVPGEFCYADDETRAKSDCEMRISFGSASLANIREGITRLGEVMHEVIRS